MRPARRAAIGQRRRAPFAAARTSLGRAATRRLAQPTAIGRGTAKQRDKR
jgi:hypothetical protein